MVRAKASVPRYRAPAASAGAGRRGGNDADMAEAAAGAPADFDAAPAPAPAAAGAAAPDAAGADAAGAQVVEVGRLGGGGRAGGRRARPSGRGAARGAARGVRRDGGVDKEVRRLQADHKYLSFTKVGFARLIRDFQGRFADQPLRWSTEALLLFQIAAEEYLMYLYADAYLATHHRRRVTLNTEDIRLVRRLRSPHCWGETT